MPRNISKQILLFLWLAPAFVEAQATAPLGDAQNLNQAPLLNAAEAAVDASADGGFVAVWVAPDDVPFFRILSGRRYAAEGTPLGAELRLSPTEAGVMDVRSPALDVDAGGEFVVAWEDADQNRVHARKYFSDGTPASEVLTVNETYDSRRPSVALADDGGFFVVWQSAGSSGDDQSVSSIQGRFFNNEGVAAVPSFQLNTYTTQSQWAPRVVRGSGDGFVVVWASFGSAGNDASRNSVQLRRFNAAGAALGDEIQINTTTQDDQTEPRLAIDAIGNLVVAWEDESTQPPKITSRRVDASGALVGAELRLNDATDVWPYAPGVAMQDDGEFAAVWIDEVVGGKRSAADGFQVGDFFAAGSHYYEYGPAIAAQGDGRYVVVWDDDRNHVKMRLFERDGDGDGVADSLDCAPTNPETSECFFSDGFETGDVSAWSSAVPR